MSGKSSGIRHCNNNVHTFGYYLLLCSVGPISCLLGMGSSVSWIATETDSLTKI